MKATILSLCVSQADLANMKSPLWSNHIQPESGQKTVVPFLIHILSTVAFVPTSGGDLALFSHQRFCVGNAYCSLSRLSSRLASGARAAGNDKSRNYTFS